MFIPVTFIILKERKLKGRRCLENACTMSLSDERQAKRGPAANFLQFVFHRIKLGLLMIRALPQPEQRLSEALMEYSPTRFTPSSGPIYPNLS
jgi:hypothetical protein